MSRKKKRRVAGSLLREKPVKSLEASPSIGFDCPFCGKSVTATSVSVDTDNNPRFTPAPSSPAIFHGMPPCAKFVALEPAEFLRASRLEFEKRVKP